ncbi:hypothetical protein HETIRDRAFT_459597 [Heterobasidion irregulare TC 32-1]|uniref:Uncharacterized protein n=1 Tax=Heterobasidion irregulare (strain TC 32-1) TaxID=747525 RepID=W4K601_HETIT|nr:uncharacterized protein HETIRDRAFT_459597 [Heterobasidion irregulare TC 32-1]ETW81199.1 hypothetical protein HETIRDRAFT_459597 [Heterobasidion irregulare TC 32-1]
MLTSLPGTQWLTQTWNKGHLLSIRRQTPSSPLTSPISILFPELLLSIFELIPFLWQPDEPSRFYDINWIAITHVCRRWRIIALNAPFLWRDIEFSTPRWTQEMLLRSQSIPINIRFHLDFLKYPPTMQKVIALAMGNIQRVRSLRLTGQVVETLIQCTTPALLLEELHLEYAAMPPPANLFIPDSLFDGSAHKLRSLFLKGLSIHLTSPLLPGLSSLTVQGDSRSPRHSLARWLDALTRMPKLETLCLIQALSRTSHAQTQGTDTPLPPTVLLPHLRTLAFTSNSLTDCVEFTRRLAIPSSTSIELRTYVASIDELTPHAIVPSYAHTPVTAFRITHTAIGFSIAGSLGDPDIPAFSLSIVIYEERSLIAQGILHTLAHFNVKSVRSLLIDLGGMTLDWAPVLSCFPLVNTIHVRGSTLHTFPKALAHSDALICPHLRRLEFEHRTPTYGKRIDETFFRILRDAVDARWANGMSLEELIVFGETLSHSGSVDTAAIGSRKIPKKYL